MWHRIRTAEFRVFGRIWRQQLQSETVTGVLWVASSRSMHPCGRGARFKSGASMQLSPSDGQDLLQQLRAVPSQKFPHHLLPLLKHTTLSSVSWTIPDLVLILQVLLQLERTTVLSQLVHQLYPGKREIDPFNQMLAINSRHGNVKVALDLYSILEDLHIEPTIATCNTILQTCSRGPKNEVHQAIDMYHHIHRHHNIKPKERTYANLLMAHIRLDQWSEVHSILNKLSHAQEGDIYKVYALAIQNCYQLWQYKAASRLFLFSLENLRKIPYNSHVLNTALAATARSTDAGKLDVLYQMLETNTDPDIYTYNTLISAYGNAGRFDGAWEIFHRMQSKMEPDVVTFNALFTACIRNHRIDRIQSVLSTMESKEIVWDVVTLNILLEACAMTQDVARAENFWKLAQEIPNFHFQRRSIETLAKVYSQAEAYDRLCEFWKNDIASCRRHARSSKMLNFLVHACSQTADPQKALEILNEFQNQGHRVSSVTYNYILQALLAADQAASALKFLQLTMEQEKIHSTIYSYSLLLGYFSRKQQYTRVLHTFDRFLSKRQTKTFSCLALWQFPVESLYILAARAAFAEKSHEKLIQIFELSEKEDFSKVVQSELAKLVVASCELFDDWKTAVSLYDHLLDVLDSTANVEMYEKVVKIVARVGEFEQALNINGGEWYRSSRE
uniref:Uncharacterized protein AlNc14C72G4905 n=1 Tax=Albugo laibachii Nc14 TaxID=890382 RepID=F0WE44_9STRA|nr:conserved hypothetical protein [Albugo laibachii Nc14]|eukprot:CCA19473.1 conserved hypothetical protein [Albugo laibachii Nc14]